MHPVTSAVLKHLKQRKQDIERGLGRGHMLVSESADQTLSATARAVGEIAGLDYVLDLYPGEEPESERKEA